MTGAGAEGSLTVMVFSSAPVMSFSSAVTGLNLIVPPSALVASQVSLPKSAAWMTSFALTASAPFFSAPSGTSVIFTAAALVSPVPRKSSALTAVDGASCVATSSFWLSGYVGSFG